MKNQFDNSNFLFVVYVFATNNIASGPDRTMDEDPECHN